ncbi:TPA: hypothetical protein O4519_002385 [Staphylococcus aureus]|nr:hypothetical protein [Staphylococcus aureus]
MGRILSAIGSVVFLIVIVRLLGFDTSFIYSILEMIKNGAIDLFHLVQNTVGNKILIISGVTLIILLIIGKTR